MRYRLGPTVGSPRRTWSLWQLQLCDGSVMRSLGACLWTSWWLGTSTRGPSYTQRHWLEGFMLDPRRMQWHCRWQTRRLQLAWAETLAQRRACRSPQWWYPCEPRWSSSSPLTARPASWLGWPRHSVCQVHGFACWLPEPQHHRRPCALNSTLGRWASQRPPRRCTALPLSSKTHTRRSAWVPWRHTWLQRERLRWPEQCMSHYAVRCSENLRCWRPVGRAGPLGDLRPSLEAERKSRTAACEA